MTDDEWIETFARAVASRTGLGDAEARQRALALHSLALAKAAEFDIDPDDARIHVHTRLIGGEVWKVLPGFRYTTKPLAPIERPAQREPPPPPEEQPVPHQPPHQEGYPFNVAGIPCNRTPGRVAVGLLAVIYFVCKWGLGWNL
jgi:hypothetical protein